MKKIILFGIVILMLAFSVTAGWRYPLCGVNEGSIFNHCLYFDETSGTKFYDSNTTMNPDNNVTNSGGWNWNTSSITNITRGGPNGTEQAPVILNSDSSTWTGNNTNNVNRYAVHSTVYIFSIPSQFSNDEAILTTGTITPSIGKGSKFNWRSASGIEMQFKADSGANYIAEYSATCTTGFDNNWVYPNWGMVLMNGTGDQFYWYASGVNGTGLTLCNSDTDGVNEQTGFYTNVNGMVGIMPYLATSGDPGDVYPYFFGTMNTIPKSYDLAQKMADGDWDTSYSTGPGPETAVNYTVNITQGFPGNGTQSNLATINFNLTGNFSYQVNATLYINGTLNLTRNFNSGQEVFVSFNQTFRTDNVFSYYINVTENITFQSSSTDENIVFYVDTSDPSITTNFINGSIYANQNLIAQFNFSDDFNLFSYNFSINGSQIAGDMNLVTTLFTYDMDYSIINRSPGHYLLTVRIADGHTAKKLAGEFDFSNGLFNDYSKYEFYDGGFIRTKLLDDSIFDSWSSYKEEDRYTQIFRPANPSSTLTFIEESDKPIHIIEKPGRYGDRWIIIGNHWKDYVLENEPNSKISIERLAYNKVQVTISGIKNTEELRFHSIGDLNIVSEDFLFIVSDTTIQADSSSIELSEQTISLDINTSSGVLETVASLYYNGSNYGGSLTSFDNYDQWSVTFSTPGIPKSQNSQNISFYWEYSINGTGNNETGYVNDSQIVYRIGIDNGTEFRMRALTIRVFDEDNESQISFPEVDGYFETWVGSINNFTTHNLSWRGYNGTNDNYGVFIFPNQSIFYSYVQMEYNASGYNKKLYYFDNTTFDNVSETLDLYLTKGTNQVELSVTDQNDNPLEGVLIKILSYDLPTNVFRTTEVLKTDSDGIGLAQMVLNNKWYAFILENNKEIVLETSPTKITSTSKKFRIQTGKDYFARYDVVRGIAYDLSFTNSSTTFRFTWDDTKAEIDQACLQLEKVSVSGSEQLNLTCSSSFAGTIFMPINDNLSASTASYKATSYVTFSGEVFILDNIIQSFDYTFREYGLSGVFFTFLIVLTLIVIGIWNPVIAIILSLFGFIISIIFGFFFIAWDIVTALIIIGGITIWKLRQ